MTKTIAKVGVIMGSRSDWPTMRHAVEVLEELGVAVESRVVSAHRTPQRLYDYAATAAERSSARRVGPEAGVSASASPAGSGDLLFSLMITPRKLSVSTAMDLRRPWQAVKSFIVEARLPNMNRENPP